jgi:hypothetical protein
MQNTEAAKNFGATNGLPINLAFGTRGGFLCRPKESPLDLIDVFKGARGNG